MLCYDSSSFVFSCVVVFSLCCVLSAHTSTISTVMPILVVEKAYNIDGIILLVQYN
jgi:hypothetical protein